MSSVIQDAISGSPVVMFSKTTCSYCTRAGELLKAVCAELGTDLFRIDLDKRQDGSAIQVRE